MLAGRAPRAALVLLVPLALRRLERPLALPPAAALGRASEPLSSIAELEGALLRGKATGKLPWLTRHFTGNRNLTLTGIQR